MAHLQERMIRAAKLDVELYEEVEADPTAMGQATTVVALSAVAAGIGNFQAGGINGIVAGALGALGEALGKRGNARGRLLRTQSISVARSCLTDAKFGSRARFFISFGSAARSKRSSASRRGVRKNLKRPLRIMCMECSPRQNTLRSDPKSGSSK